MQIPPELDSALKRLSIEAQKRKRDKDYFVGVSILLRDFIQTALEPGRLPLLDDRMVFLDEAALSFVEKFAFRRNRHNDWPEDFKSDNDEHMWQTAKGNDLKPKSVWGRAVNLENYSNVAVRASMLEPNLPRGNRRLVCVEFEVGMAKYESDEVHEWGTYLRPTFIVLATPRDILNLDRALV